MPSGLHAVLLGFLPVAFTNGISKVSSPGPMSVASKGCEWYLIVGCIVVKHWAGP